MDKRGTMRLKADNDAKCLDRATAYLAALAGVGVHRIVHYRTDRGADIGVVVNEGERVGVWNAFREKVEHYSQSDFKARLMEV